MNTCLILRCVLLSTSCRPVSCVMLSTEEELNAVIRSVADSTESQKDKSM